MDGTDEPAKEVEVAEVADTVSFKFFLEEVHANIQKSVANFWEVSGMQSSKRRLIVCPELRLHCAKCKGVRTFRNPEGQQDFYWSQQALNWHPVFRCGDCNKTIKQYALRVVFNEGAGGGRISKYGEYPPFGVPVPNKLLRMLGSADAELFMKGRQCETLGYGIAAFAYYRRVVENHRTDLFREILKVCDTLGVSGDLIQELEAAKKEISFAKSMEKIKTGLPEGLLIDGHNPLNALHSALSVSIHNESDQDCLEYAQAVRLVLGDLVERIAMLKQDNKQLSDAVQRLLAKRAK